MSNLDAADDAASGVYGRAEIGSDIETLADALRAVIVVLRRFEEAIPGLQERFTELAEEFRAVKEKVDSIPGVWGDWGDK